MYHCAIVAERRVRRSRVITFPVRRRPAAAVWWLRRCRARPILGGVSRRVTSPVLIGRSAEVEAATTAIVLARAGTSP